MSKIVFTFAISILCSLNVYSQWELRYPNLPEDKITGITFTSDSIGFFVNDIGSIFKTSNGGKSWKSVFSDGVSSFTSIQFINDQIGFAYAYMGSCFTFTTDGGETWKQDDLDMHLALDVVGFSSSEFLKTDENGIYKVTSVFSDWEQIYTIPTKLIDGGDLFYKMPVAYPRSMQQTSDSSLVILFFNQYRHDQLGKQDSLNYLIKSNDRGESWDSVFVDIDDEITQLKMVNFSKGFALTKGGDLFLTEDNGSNWERLTLPQTDRIPHSITTFGTNKIYIKAHKQVLVSKNNGETWDILDVPPSIYSTGYAISDKNLFPLYDLILRVNDETEEWIYGKQFQRIHGTKIYFKTPELGWVFGSGSPYYSKDGGYSWEADSTFPVDPKEIKFINESDGWIIGKHDIYKTIDAGTTWNEIILFESDLEFYDAHILFDGSFGIIYANVNCPELSCGNLAITTDAGKTWSLKDVPTYFESLSLSDNNIFGVSDKKLFVSSNKGNSWEVSYDYSFENGYPRPIVRSLNKMIWLNIGSKFLAYSKDGGESWRTTSGNADRDMALIGPYYDGSYNLFLPTQSSQIQKINSDLGVYDKRLEETYTDVTFHDIEYILDKNNDAHIWVRGFYNTILYRKGNARINVSNSQEIVELPQTTTLNQNYPNPFNPTTTFSFELSQSGDIRLSVFNMIGQEVAVLQNNKMSAGQHSINFDGSNLSSGTYFYRLKTANQVLTKKFTLIK